MRGAKENLIAFFQHILTSAEPKDIKRMTAEFGRFHRALATIEDTKIFGKRSKRWGSKLHEMQKQRRMLKPPTTTITAAAGASPNSKTNPIHISSSNNSSVQCSPQKVPPPQQQRQLSTEPLMNVVAERRYQMEQHRRQQLLQRQQMAAGSMPMPFGRPQMAGHPQRAYPPQFWPSANGRGRGHHHWSMRGYPSSMGAPKGYYGGRTLNEQWRHELAGDAEKLRARQLADRRRFDDDKDALRNDLDSHLTPNRKRNGNDSAAIAAISASAPRRGPWASPKHHALFDSLKAPLTAPPKKQRAKTGQSAVRGPAAATLPTSAGSVAADSNTKKEDTDSTVSTSTTTTAPTDTAKVGEVKVVDAASTSFHFDFAETDRVLDAIEHITCGQNQIQRTKYEEAAAKELTAGHRANGEGRSVKRKRPPNETEPDTPNPKRIKL